MDSWQENLVAFYLAFAALCFLQQCKLDGKDAFKSWVTYVTSILWPLVVVMSTIAIIFLVALQIKDKITGRHREDNRGSDSDSREASP